jgi:hypothetical protein
LKVSIDPFHSGLILIDLNAFGDSGLYSLFKFTKYYKRAIHLFYRVDDNILIEFILNLFNLVGLLTNLSHKILSKLFSILCFYLFKSLVHGDFDFDRFHINFMALIIIFILNLNVKFF